MQTKYADNVTTRSGPQKRRLGGGGGGRREVRPRSRRRWSRGQCAGHDARLRTGQGTRREAAEAADHGQERPVVGRAGRGERARAAAGRACPRRRPPAAYRSRTAARRPCPPPLAAACRPPAGTQPGPSRRRGRPPAPNEANLCTRRRTEARQEAPGAVDEHQECAGSATPPLRRAMHREARSHAAELCRALSHSV